MACSAAARGSRRVPAAAPRRSAACATGTSDRRAARGSWRAAASPAPAGETTKQVMSPARNSSELVGHGVRRRAPSRVSGRAAPSLDRAHLGRPAAGRDHADDAAGRLRQGRHHGVVRAVEQHGAVAQHGHPAVVVDGHGARQPPVGTPAQSNRSRVGGAVELVVEPRLEPLEAAAGPEPVQPRRARRRRAGTARGPGTAARRPARTRSPRRGRWAPAAAAARRRRSARGGRRRGRGGRRRGRGRRGTRPWRRPARCAATTPTTGPTSAAAARPPARGTTCRWRGRSISPTPSSRQSRRRIRRAVGSPSARSPTIASGPFVLGHDDEPAAVRVPVELLHAARGSDVTGAASPPSTGDHVQLPAGAAVGQERQRARRRARTAARGRRRRRRSAAAAGRRRTGTSQIAHRSRVAARRPARVGDEPPVRGERHLAERDLPPQVGRFDHAMTSTWGVPPPDPPRARAPSSGSRSRPRSGRASARASSAAAATARARARRARPGSCRTGRRGGSPRTRRRRSAAAARRGESTSRYQWSGLPITT